jgi:haloalkane dehalogenase
MPINGEPTDVVARIEHFDTWLADSTTVPKLLLTFDGSPTLMIDPAATAWCQANIANLDTEYCGSAGHLSPEDQPEQIAAAIRAWANNRGLAPTA